VEARLEHGFIAVLRAQQQQQQAQAAAPAAPGPVAVPAPGAAQETVIEVKDLVRRFGDFTAVASTTFSVQRGEIFGLLGPNGAGKTTTFRMLCGLLPATSGHLRVAGVDLRHARAKARRRVGYVSQKFALYGNLTVAENLEFFGGAYGLHGRALRDRMQTVLQQFDLAGALASPSGQLPGGYKQRLAMATGLLHEPDILFLDEPTSGTDVLARRDFWRRITALAQGGTTIIITTHFMEEAEYCDRIVIQDAGKVLAIGTPREVRTQALDGESHEKRIDMEQAFIGIVEKARHEEREKKSEKVAA
jgi:ABC-2 type transport system ATP-binding protein